MRYSCYLPNCDYENLSCLVNVVCQSFTGFCKESAVDVTIRKNFGRRHMGFVSDLVLKFDWSIDLKCQGCEPEQASVSSYDPADFFWFPKN